MSLMLVYLLMVVALVMGLGLLGAGIFLLTRGGGKDSAAFAGGVVLIVVGAFSGLGGLSLVAYSVVESVFDFRGGSETKKLVERENRYTSIGFEQLGDYLGRTYPKSKAVLVTNVMYPSDDPKSRDNMTIAALKKGIGERLTIVHTKNFGPPPATGAKSAAGGSSSLPPPMMMMPEMMITAKDWDDLLKEYPDADMFITLAGLPMDVDKMKLWSLKDGERPKLVLVNAQQLSMLYQPIAKGMINVVLHPNPSAPYDPKKPIPTDPKAAFDDRWLLITPANVAQIARANKGLFMVDLRQLEASIPPTTARSTP